MCGIAGFVDWGARDRDTMTAVLARMDAAIARRGPDGAGREIVCGTDGAVAYLAHRRLAILDRSSAGRQPMVSADRRHWITYNGEIYNFLELQPRIADRGVVLRSHSDTEVLLELLAHDGVEALPQVRGMFAFAWFDTGRGALTLGRDRFGIKPLVFVRPQPDLLLFASTPQALEASGLWTLRPSPRQRAAFLATGSVPGGESFWEGVSVVAPGTCVTARRGGDAARTYWSIDHVWRQPRPERPVAEVAPRIRAAIAESVGAHLVSDVPVAVFLSGGLDSSIIAAAARAQTSGPLQSLTVTMAASRLDESASARAAAERFGTTHTEVALEDLDLDQVLDEFVASLAEPTVDGFNTFLVARAARMAGVQVALSGVGGDELLGGYPSFTEVPTLFASLTRWGSAARFAGPVLARWPSSRMTKLGTIAVEAPSTLDETWWAYRGLWSRTDVARLTGRAVPPVPSSGGNPADPFDIIRDLEWRRFLQRQLLPDADAVTMCRALELRTPFVDHHVVEAVAAAGRWPRGSRSSWKAALCEAWPEWTTPAARHRPKQGFVLPIDVWLRIALSSPRPTAWRDVATRLRQPRYAGDVAAFLAGRLHWSRLWAVYVLERMETPS